MRGVCVAALMVAGMLAGGAQAEEARPGILWFHPGYTTPRSFMRRMPEYEHTWVTASPLRIHEQLKAMPNACTPLYQRTPEREAAMLFSQPVMIFLPNGLITTRPTVERVSGYLDSQGALRLEESLRQGALRVATLSGRTYGAALDALVRRQARTSAVVELSPADILFSGLLKLLARREFDGLLGSSAEVSFLAQNFGFDPSELVFLPVAEATEPLEVSIACARSAQGEQVIARVNALRHDPALIEELVSAYRSLLPPEEQEKYDRLRSLTPLPRTSSLVPGS